MNCRARRRLFPTAVALVAAVASSGCGGGGPAAAPIAGGANLDPAARAQYVVFHSYDFPSRWTPITDESPEARFDLHAQLNACLPAPMQPTAKVENLWTETPPTAVRSLAEVLADETTARAVFTAIASDGVRECFRQRVFDFIKMRLPASQLQPTLLLESDPISVGVDAVDYRMRATPIVPGGPSAYAGFVFLQHGPVVAMLNFYSTAAFPDAMRGALIRSVADRMRTA